MANYWAIIIGINQYRHFQPLMHAQEDALLTRRFFVEEAGIPADHCVLLSDLTTSVAEQAVYPDKPAIAQWVQTIVQQVAEDDVVWFFFSGYGAQVDGKDYLMPIDGDPDSVEGTGVAVADLIESLAKLPTEHVLLALDINRSQSALAGQSIGTQVIELAEANNVTAFLSCQPEQYSHETLGVRHGLFTAAFLEAVHQDCKTPAQISEYLNKRVPELCEHHWRPVQNPVVVMTETAAQAEDVPELQNTLATDVAITDETNDERTAVTVGSNQANKLAAGVGAGTVAVATGKALTEDLSGKGGAARGSDATDSAEEELNGGRLIQPPYTEETISTGSYRTSNGLDDTGNGDRTSDDDHSEIGVTRAVEEDSMAVTGAKLRNWGLLALALLMGGVLLKQPFVQTAWQGLGERLDRTGRTADGRAADDSGETTADLAGAESAPSAPEDGAAEDAATEKTATDPAPEGIETLSDGEALPAPDVATEVATADTDETAPNAEDAEAEKADASPTPAESDVSPTDAEGSEEASSAATNEDAATDEKATDEKDRATAQALIAQANSAIEQRQYSEALIALQQVPRSQRNSTFSEVLTKARTGSAEAQQTNASVLTEARTSIQPTQASQFTEAIAKARLIQPGEPYYEAAQRDIRSWSQVILDIAEGRATSGNLDGAIAAANVMPYDNAEFHQKAQDRIAFWQQRQNSRNIITTAQKIPKLGQASTYQKGIVKLREVPIEHPEYETAQRLADQWSQSIFSIAQARAAQGRQNAAVQAAILVPAGTTAYEPTQQAIRRWKAEE